MVSNITDTSSIAGAGCVLPARRGGVTRYALTSAINTTAGQTGRVTFTTMGCVAVRVDTYVSALGLARCALGCVVLILPPQIEAP